jgi:K+-sensing histidine kinase KdpD
MNGQLTLYRDRYGIVPVAVSLVAILWTTMVLTTVQSNLVTDDPEDLALAYLLPTIFIAVFFGSTLAVASSFASGLAAAYFTYPPKFSLYIVDPRHVAELGFILLLAVTASKAMGDLTDDKPPNLIPAP